MQNENEDLGAGFIMFIIIFQESNATHGDEICFHTLLFLRFLASCLEFFCVKWARSPLGVLF